MTFVSGSTPQKKSNPVPFRRLSRKEQLDKIFKYVRASNDDLDAVCHFIRDEIGVDNQCRKMPIANYDLCRKYNIELYSNASMIIGYLEELKSKK